MKSQTTGYVLFVCTMLLLSGLACSSMIDKGELEVGEAVVFEAHDETDYFWKAEVTPGEKYVLSVTNDEYGEASYYGFMHIYDEGTITNEDASNLVAEGEHFTPSVSFVAPEDGTVTIVVYMINWIDTDVEVTLTKSDD
ncbi:MAG: hypothetical protein JXB30_08150 [Anaerolineae bacterium]|nr:hypothetical protein [Anaerolineae bacterium]